jgi:hypothetical protein
MPQRRISGSASTPYSRSSCGSGATIDSRSIAPGWGWWSADGAGPAQQE